MDKRKEITGVLGALGGSVLFGLSFLFTKEAVNDYSAFTLLAWRFIFAFAAMSICALAGIIKIRLRGKSLLPLLAIAVFQPVMYFIGETYGIDLTTASESGTLTTCIPIVTIVMCSVIIKEPPTKLQVIGICVSVAGVLMIVLVKGLEASFNGLGYIMLVIAMVSDALYVTYCRKFSQYTPAEKTYIQAGVGAVAFTLCALVENGMKGTLGSFITAPFKDADFLIAVIYLAVACQILAFLMSNHAIQTIGPARCTSFAGITTVVSVLSGVLILGEGFSLMQGAGTLLVLAGVYAANRLPRGARITPIPPEEEPAGDSGK